MDIVLTKVTTPIIGWISSVLGWIINAIYMILDAIGIPNIGLSIILFTLVIYLLMTPLQIKQQKFSKLNSVMQPEIQKIQKKYKNKKDQDSMMKQNEEINAVYQKYGVSPTGSCVQLIIQLPVLLALYQVIYHIPGYITGVRNVFSGLAAKIMEVPNFGEVLSNFLTDNKISMYGITANTEFTRETTIDFLYKLTPSQMDKLSDLSQFSGLSELFDSVSAQASRLNNFLTLNISDTPWSIVQSGWEAGSYLLVIAAVMIPVLAWFTQWLNYKLIPQQQNSSSDQPSTMEATMKGMNTFMPIMSAIFCFSFPVGIGIYWIVGAVIRSVQQIVINNHMKKMDMEDLIRHNQEKMKKKLERKGVDPQKINQQINQQARMSARNIQEIQKKKETETSAEEKTANIKKSTDYYNSANKNFKPGSLAAKANMVRQYDEKKGKKK